jgi:hypothetical protein
MIITPLLVTFMLVVFVLLFLFLKTVDKRKWLTLLVSAVLTPLVYFHVFYPFINIITNYHHQKYFKTEIWIEEPGLRYEMANNIIASDTLVGLSKEQIIRRLGQYEWLTWDDQNKRHDDNRWNFGMGIEPGAFNTKRECLELVFKNDLVVELKPYQETISYEEKDE